MLSGQWYGQLLFKPLDLAQRLLISFPWGLLPYIGGDHDINLMANVIKGQQTVEKHQHRVRNLQIIFSKAGQLLQLPHGIMGKIAYCARGKRGESRNMGDFMFIEQAVENFENTAVHLLFFAAALQDDPAAM